MGVEYDGFLTPRPGYAVLEKVYDISPSFDDNNFVALVNGRTCRKPILAIFRYLHDSHRVGHFVSQFRA
jgi:hypothetical protein